MASRLFSVMANPTLYSTLRPRTLPCAVSQSSRSWDAPAPSERTSSFLGCVADLRDRVTDDRDVVGPARPNHRHLVAGHPGRPHRRRDERPHRRIQPDHQTDQTRLDAGSPTWTTTGGASWSTSPSPDSDRPQHDEVTPRKVGEPPKSDTADAVQKRTKPGWVKTSRRSSSATRPRLVPTAGKAMAPSPSQPGHPAGWRASDRDWGAYATAIPSTPSARWIRLSSTVS